MQAADWPDAKDGWSGDVCGAAPPPAERQDEEFESESRMKETGETGRLEGGRFSRSDEMRMKAQFLRRLSANARRAAKPNEPGFGDGQPNAGMRYSE